MTDHRFQPGQSGNSRGRPRGSKNRKTIAKQVAFEEHNVPIDGARRKVTTIELAVLELRNQVAAGQRQALQMYNALLEKYGEPNEAEGGGVMVAPAEMSVEDWVAEQEELNKTRKPPPELDLYEDDC